MAKLGVESRASAPLQTEHIFPQDALITREFVRHLPGFKPHPEGKEPNWSGVAVRDGKKIEIRAWENEATRDLTLDINMPGREDLWRVRTGQGVNGRRFSYISFEREWSRVQVFPLDENSDLGVIPNSEMGRFSEKAVRYVLKEDFDEESLLREEDIDTAAKTYNFSESSMDNHVYKSIKAIRNLMLKATPSED